MRRLARAGLRGAQLLAADAAAAPPLATAGARGALASAALCSQLASAAARGASAAAAGRGLAAPCRALSTSAEPAPAAEAGAEPPQQPPTHGAAAAHAGDGRSFSSRRAKEGPRREGSVATSRPAKAPSMSQASLILPMNRKLAQLLTVGKHEEARALFERWREGKATEDDGVTAVPFQPDVFSYQHYMAASVKENGAPKGSLASLKAALAEMKARDIPLRNTVFTPFAWLAFSLNDWTMGKRLYEMMLRHEVIPNDTTYSYFFTVAVAADDVRGAGDILATAMANNKLQAGRDSARIASSVNEVFYAAVKHRYHDVAFNALSVMRMHGSLPPSASLTELAAGTADVDNVPCALAALKAFADKEKDYRKDMDEGSVLTLLNCAARNRDTALAREAMAQLQVTVEGRGGVPPASDASQVALISCAALVGDVAAAFAAANALRHLGVAPPALMKPLVELLARGGAGALDEAYFVAERMHKAGVLQGDGTVNVLNAIIAACARSRDMERAFQTFEVIEPTFGVPVTTGAYNGLIAACLATRSEPAVANLVEEMRAKGVPHDDATRLLLLDAALALRDHSGVLAILSSMLKAAKGGHVDLSAVMRRRVMTLAKRGDEDAQTKLAELLTKFRLTSELGLRPKSDLVLDATA